MRCMNKKVIGGLAAVGLATLVVAPQLFGRVLGLLLVLACPLSMVLMVRGMSGGRSSCSPGGTATTTTDGLQTTGQPVELELRELREEVNRLRADAARREGATPPDAPDSRPMSR